MKKLITLCLGLVFLTSCEKEDIVPVSNQQISVPPVVAFDPFAALPKETAIPDSNFEKVLIEMGIDKILDGKVTTLDVQYKTDLVIKDSKGIQSLKGIESFISLTKLIVHHQKIKEIDVTKNINLQTLHLWDHPLTQIDITKNTKLQSLVLSAVNIEYADLSNNKDLIEIDYSNGDLSQYGATRGFKSIDVSKNTKLIRLWFGRNRFTELDVSMCPNLTDVWIHDNPQLTSFKYIPTSKLIMFAAWNTGLESIDLKGAYPLAIHVYDNEKLKTVKVSSLRWLNDAIARNSVAYTKDVHTQWAE